MYKEETTLVKSPITGTPCNPELRYFMTDEIIHKYLKSYGYDVSYLFKGTDKIGLYSCPDTGYQFFYPGIEGDSNFYGYMQHKKKNYYMNWKWEHEEALQHIKTGSCVLEIGSGTGGFLSGIIRERQVHACGLELNTSAIESATLCNLSIINESIAQHAKTHTGSYDVICAFQVLEHIYDVRGFMNSAVDCLKKGGLLIISVPDNDSFVGSLDPISDYPPHHLGRYTIMSIEKIGEVFGLKKNIAIKEPLQKYHYAAVESILLRELFGVNRFIRNIFIKMGGLSLVRKMLTTCGKWMNGHTVLVVFQK